MPKLNKNLVSILALIFFLALGFFVSQREEKQKLENYQIRLEKIQEKVTRAESFLILKETRPQAGIAANSFLKEGWEEISSLVKESTTFPSSFRNQVSSLKDRVANNLFELNKLKIIETPELFFEFDSQKLIPQKMAIFNNELYFFSPYAQNLFKINQKGESELIQIDKKFNLAADLDDSILFFTKANQLTIMREGRFYQSMLEVVSDFNYEELSVYKSNLYFLDKKSGEIIKYLFFGNFEWGSPQLWLSPQTKRAFNSKSITVDGSVWILNKDNSITKYYGGWPQETIFLDIFPSLKNSSKIFTSPILPYLYLLEPEQNRIVILNKSGQIVKQFQSERFNSLLDFAISENGKTIYLLSGLKVFTLTLL